jgi:hypothetical protein
MRCKNCRTKFEPKAFLEKYCQNKDCQIEKNTQMALKNLAKYKREKKERLNKTKESLLTTSDYLKIAQKVFNTYIRLRDKNDPCISCGTRNGKKNAGHYYSQGGHSNVRFDEDNVHLQCEYCNTYLSANLINYTKGLEEKIGHSRLMNLSQRAQAQKKWTMDEVKDLIKEYKEKTKQNEKH